MKTQRILVISERYYPDSSAIAVRMKYIVEELEKSDAFRPKLITTTRSKSRENLKISRTFFQSSRNEQLLPRRLLQEIFLGMEILIRTIFSRYQYALITSPPFFIMLIAILGIRLRRKPFILDVRDNYPEVFFDLALLRRHGFIGRTLISMIRGIYQKAYKVSTVTVSIQKEIQKQIDNPEKVILVRNGFDSKLFQPASQRYEKFTVAFHSNLGQFHDIDLLLQVCMELEQKDPAIEVLIIGEGREENRIRHAPYGNIRYLGKVEHDLIGEHIQKAHIGLSFKKEGSIGRTAIPTKVYEFLGVGIPVINTPVGESGELLEEKGMGFQFNAHDAQGIVNKIIELKKNKKALDKAITNVIKNREQYSRQTISENFIKSILQ